VVPEGIARNYLQMMGLSLLTLRDAWAEREFYVCVRDKESLPSGVARLLEYLSRCEAMEQHFLKPR
jgi:DNA-binding transcriptional LysR family regulator